MGILEKLRPQPRWKHADPGVRAAAVYELGPDEGEALRLLAREDAEARVRRAAVTRLSDVSVLGDIGRTDPDEDVRAEAIRGLAGLAAEAEDVDRASEAVRQLVALARFKEVVIAARENPDPQIRGVVVDLLDDPKSLGAISRHAQDGATRLRALARLSDADEILNVAIKSEHTDVAVSALDRVDGSEGLSAIAQRARNKVAARRARMKLRQHEEAAQPHHETAAPMSAEDRERAVGLLHRAEALVTTADTEEATSALADVRLAWAELQADAEMIDASLAQRFEAASEAVREAIDVRRQERAAEDERAAAIAREQTDRVAIVSEIEQLSGPEALDRIAELRVRWDGLPPMPSEYAASLTRRFQDASRMFEDRERRRVLAEAAAGRLETLATELEQLLASDQPVEEVVARWRGLRRDADVLREHAPANVSAAERLERAVASLEEKELLYQQARAKVEQDNLRRLQQSVSSGRDACRHRADHSQGRRSGAARDPDGDGGARSAAVEEGSSGHPGAARGRRVAALAPRVQELRDADEWQRWANLQVQEEICKEMEALKAEENLDVAGRRMRELQARWKPVALAPRAQGEVMWRRFKTAQDEVFARTSAHFAAQNEERAANLARKQALCAKAEALADSTDWVKTATEIQALQAEWKGIGPVARGHEKAIWERFRASCDRFFTRRQEDLKRRKEEWSGNLARKEALCAKAEALADSTEWDSAAAQFKQLQAEWKTIGPVRKSRSEAIWQRFRAACDRFFDRFKHRDQLELQEKAAVRDTVIRELEASGARGGRRRKLPRLRISTRRFSRRGASGSRRRSCRVRCSRISRPGITRPLAGWSPCGRARLPAPISIPKPRASGWRSSWRVSRRSCRRSRRSRRISRRLNCSRSSCASVSPPTRCPAANRTADNEESRWRASEQEVRSAQAQWMRLGPVPPNVAGPLNERFQRACRKFFDSRRRAS